MISALTGHDNTVCSVFARPTVSRDLIHSITWLRILGIVVEHNMLLEFIPGRKAAGCFLYSFYLGG